MIGAPIGTSVGGVLDVLRIGSLAATEAADIAAFSGFVFTADIATTEAPDTATFTARAFIPFSATRSIGSGRGKGPVSAGRATGSASSGYGKATIGR